MAVDHPALLAMSPAGHVAIVFRPEGGFHLVDVDLVTDLEVRLRAETSSDAERT